ncbi:fibropellin-1-like [Dendronephthya gigantea]|uniref:fibropellin-1-like n=1 Tax=Dendronephthya gigantea TaxID=151771 RepID=UPI001069FEB0|nr:fibropellin-1-like [Dendronephthya gigantea]
MNVDECLPSSPCHSNATCNNTDGSYTCTCNSGYTGDGFNCTDGSYICTCNSGYTGDGFNCTGKKKQITFMPIDVDECLPSSPCHSNATCNNTDGSYTCTCNSGYTGDGFNCTDGSYICTCNSGYTGDGFNCTDVDECLPSSPCHSNATCNNTDGSYTCTCNSGYTGDGFNCTDVDECLPSSPCHSNATCNNTDGSYTCTCNSGYTGDGFNCTDGSYICTCNSGYTGDGFNCTGKKKQITFMPIDVDECLPSSPCHSNATCNNTDGSYTCTCNSGYTGDGFNCTDGSYICTCNSGYTGDGFNCTGKKKQITFMPIDVDECLPSSPCHSNATCNNTDGSYTCTCNSGYTGDGFNCTDGSYICTCNSGYTGDGFNCTGKKKQITFMPIDVDECLPSSPCHSNATCNNTDGSYTCTCNSGYTGDGFNCTDGSYICTCNSGYTGDGFNCTDFDECLTSSPCHSNATCNNTDGSYTCTCNSGYSGDGFNCTGKTTQIIFPLSVE